MQQPSLPLAPGPTTQRRGARGGILGRPPKARNKRSSDLARWVEHEFAGQTPGQQAAELAMVRPADLRRAKADADELGLVAIDLPPMMLAMVVRATKLAKALRVDTATAWVMLQKERADLMPYIHQRQAQAVDNGKPKAPATVFLIPEGEALAQLPDMTDQELDFADDFQPVPDEVPQTKSHDDEQSLIP